MYRMNEIEVWNQRRDELVREAEGEHLARSLRAGRPGRAAWLRDVLFGRTLEAPVAPCAQSGGRA